MPKGTRNSDGTFSYPKGVISNISKNMARRTRKFNNKLKMVRAVVKNELSKELETKYRSQAPVIKVGYNGTIDNADIIPLIPKLVQGQPTSTSSIYERLGTKLTPRKLNIKCMVNLLGGLNRSTNVVVHYYVLTHKSLKYMPDLTLSNDISTNLFKTGDSNEIFGFDGQYLNSTFPINDSAYVCLKKGKFLLGKNTGDIQDSTTAGNQPVYGNSTCKFLDFDIKTPAKFVYDQDSNSPRVTYYPNNFAPFMVFGYYHQDQTATDEANTDIQVTLRHSLWYDDA